MSLLRSRAIRVFYSKNGTITDQTESLRTWGSPNFTFSFTASEDALFIGKAHKFNNLYISFNSPNSLVSVMTVSFWNGTTWEPFSDLLDETNGFIAGGFITFEEKLKWAKCYPNSAGISDTGIDHEMYWIKVTLSADTSPNITMRAVKQLLSDDRLLTTIHPEIMSYLPSGATDFLPQHELAKDVVIVDLISAGEISYEDQIKNPENYLLAASYKCIELILAPIPGDDRLKAVKDVMAKSYTNSLLKTAADIDRDKSETLDQTEVEPGQISHLGR